MFLGSQPGNDSARYVNHWPGATGVGADGVKAPSRLGAGIAGAVGGIGIPAGAGALGAIAAPGPRPDTTAAVMPPPTTSAASASHGAEDLRAGAALAWPETVVG